MFRLRLGNRFKYVTLQEGLQYIEFCRTSQRVVPILEQELDKGLFLKLGV